MDFSLGREENERFWDVALMAVRHGEQKNANGLPGERGEAAVVSLSGDWQPIQDRPQPRFHRPRGRRSVRPGRPTGRARMGRARGSLDARAFRLPHHGGA